MATPVFCCGFECRYVDSHWSRALGGSLTVQNTYARNSGYALRIVNSSSAGRAAVTVLDGLTYAVIRYYLYFVTLPGADVVGLSRISTNSGASYYLGYTQSTSKLCLGPEGAQIAGPVVAAGTWYQVDIKVNPSANPHLIDWQIDAVAQTQVSNAVTASTCYLFSVGTVVTGTYDVCFDDVVISSAVADYPWGAGLIKGYVPVSDGTHNVT